MIESFLVVLFAFVCIGIISVRQSKGTRADYYIASGSVRAWLVGLSAVATNNSGFMFIGLIGYTYATGLAAIWMMLGWITGDFLASLFVHKRLNSTTTHSAEVSYAGVLSCWQGTRQQHVQRLIGIISLLFLLTYAAAQLVAGSKALHVLLDWPLWAGALVGAVLVCCYCIAGGIRASIWTDAAQSIVMIFAMGSLLWVAVGKLGGIDSALTQLHQIDGFMAWFPAELPAPGLSGMLLFVIGWGAAGLSVIGQPHIMVRFMSLDNASHIAQARIWYYLWFVLFWLMATAVGLLSRLYFADTALFDAELALPTLALELLSPVGVGLILAGIFAATMSTADSLILSCSAAITHDLLPHKVEKTRSLKLTTMAITALALLLALTGNNSVFAMVIFAWSALASAFGPLMLTLCCGGKPNQTTTIIAMLTGFSVSMAWRWGGLDQLMYEGLPGILAGLAVFILSALIKRVANKPVCLSTIE